MRTQYKVPEDGGGKLLWKDGRREETGGRRQMEDMSSGG